MSKEDGYIGEDGEFYPWPKPMRGTYETPGARQHTLQHARKIVDNPEVYGERLVGLHKHYIHLLTGRTFRKGKWRR